MADATHTCPRDGCTRQVQAHMLMCKTDWYLVPKPLREAINRAWDHGRGAGSPAHRQAMLAAIASVNRDDGDG